MKNIVLVGFMGTGKTKVSKILATRLKKQRLCTDDMLEYKVGKPIARIFEEDGEPFFRKAESEIVAAISKDKDAIIDAGGGVVINKLNVKRLKENGILFCLTARPEVILERTKDYRHRPLLDTDDQISRINKLLSERAQYYRRADYTIDTSDMTLDEIADKILRVIESHESLKKPYFIFS